MNSLNEIGIDLVAGNFLNLKRGTLAVTVIISFILWKHIKMNLLTVDALSVELSVVDYSVLTLAGHF